jgi:L-ascorbate metabolism protein UlaG (beta-lactamase superfamily)
MSEMSVANSICREIKAEDRSTSVYLRPNALVEPLVDQWYAWTHLIPPATCARNLTERHFRIMDSYIAAPQLHANAVKNPKMLGGPFIDYNGGRVDEIKSLRVRTTAQRDYLVALSNALTELDQLLQARAKGESLHVLYPKIPALLKGYVELVYDLNNHPSYRLIEPLLYRSNFYRPDSQSIMLSKITGDDRPFVLSTPRLSEPQALHMRLPFASESLDYLFSAKRDPKPYQELVDRCCITGEDEPIFSALFTGHQPAPYERYQGKGARWRYFGHACILLETPSMSLLFDPVLSYTYDSGISRYTYDDLPERIDYVVITHNHQDHVLLETLLQIRHKVGCVVVPRCGGGSLADPSLKLMLQMIGFRNVVELNELETMQLEPTSFLTGLPFMGEHADLDIRSKLAYLVDLRGNKLLFAADSCNIEPVLYQHLHREIGDVRALFIGMECDGAPLSWLYGPLLTRQIERAQDESRRLSGSNYDQAIEIVNLLRCREVFVYAMGQEPWLNYVMSIKYTPESNPIIQSNRFIEACRQRGMLAERLFGEREMCLD